MQPFSFYVEGSADELTGAVDGALDNVLHLAEGDDSTAAAAREVSAAAVDLADPSIFGDGVTRYGVSVTGALRADDGDTSAPLHSVSLVVTTIERVDTPSSGDTAGEVNAAQV